MVAWIDVLICPFWLISQVALLPSRWIILFISGNDPSFRLATQVWAAIFWVITGGVFLTYDAVVHNYGGSMLAAQPWMWCVICWFFGFFGLTIRTASAVFAHGVYSAEHVQAHRDLLQLFGVRLFSIGKTNAWAYTLSGCLPAIMAYAAGSWIQEGNQKIICHRGSDGRLVLDSNHCVVKDLTLDIWTAAPRILGNAAALYGIIALFAKCFVKLDPEASGVLTEFDGFQQGARDDSQNVVIADVDCTAGGKSKCDEVGDDLNKFAEGLGPSCGPANLELCDDAKKAEIAKIQAMSDSEREASIKEKEEAMSKLEADFKAFVEGLQKQYKDESTKKDEAVEAVKSSGLGLLKAVHNFEKKKQSEL